MLDSNQTHAYAADAVYDVRLSTGEGADRGRIRRLARAAGGPVPSGALLVAELRGRPVAAVALADGSAIYDPSEADPAIVRYLRLRRLETYLIGSIWGG